MKRLWLICLICAAAVAGGAAAFAQDSSAVSFTHYGHACFLITTSHGTRIMIDPPKLEGYPIADDVKPDLVTVSHRHIDHDNFSAVAGKPLVLIGVNGPMENGRGLEHKFIPIDTQVKDVRMYDIVSNHFNPKKSPVLNSIFVYEFAGIRVVHLGDLGLTLTAEQLQKIGAVDILMIPVGGIYTIEPAQQDSVIAQLKPKMIVFPMHYKTAVADFLAHTAEDFLKGKQNVQRIAGNTFTIDPKKPPKEMLYVVLNAPAK